MLPLGGAVSCFLQEVPSGASRLQCPLPLGKCIHRWGPPFPSLPLLPHFQASSDTLQISLPVLFEACIPFEVPAPCPWEDSRVKVEEETRQAGQGKRPPGRKLATKWGEGDGAAPPGCCERKRLCHHYLGPGDTCLSFPRLGGGVLGVEFTFSLLHLAQLWGHFQVAAENTLLCSYLLPFPRSHGAKSCVWMTASHHRPQSCRRVSQGTESEIRAGDVCSGVWPW